MDDFRRRFLVVDDTWTPLAESMLIERFKPVWNRVLDGFGNHDPGKGRHQGMAPQWDCLHPGRAWAARLRPCANTAEQLAERVERRLRFIGLVESTEWRGGRQSPKRRRYIPSSRVPT
jgi:hypothetical protein